MQLLLTLILGCITVSAGAPVLTSPFVQTDAWVPEVGDKLIIDMQANRGYLLGTDGSYTAFPVGSGQKRVVRYIGKIYNAATPLAQWTVHSLDIKKGDRATYGITGRFFRLSHANWGTSQYGIHATSNIKDILAMDNRFKSMGCILVSEEILDILEQTFALNKQSIEVITTTGVDMDALSMNPSTL